MALKPGTPTEILNMIEKRAGEVIADGDEHAAMLFCLKTHDAGYIVDTIVAVEMPEPQHREAMCRQLGPMVDQFDGYIFVCEGWMVLLQAVKDMTMDEVQDYIDTHRIPRPTQHPERVETFMVHFVSKLGDTLDRVYLIRRPTDGKPFIELERESTEPLGGIFGNLYCYSMEGNVGPAN